MNFKFLVLSIFLISSIVHAQDSVLFAVIGDYGTANINEQHVAELVDSWNPAFVITLGDNSYDNRDIDDNIGQFYSQYIGSYIGGYGSGADTNCFFPCPGNHDWTDGAGITAYLSYFTLPGAGITTSNTSGNERYYDFIQGPVHFFALSSHSSEYDGVISTSTQAQWLEMQMSNSTSPWQIVYMHHPPYSSSTSHGSQLYMQWSFEDWGADAVLGGHDHTYERLMRDDNNDGTIIPYIVNGLGGRNPYGFPSSGFVEGSEFRYNANFGAMKGIATDNSLRLYFYSIDSVDALKDSLVIDKTPTDVDETESGLPDGFAISQNYPNPFNPATTVEFSVPYKMFITIEVYNILGEKVKSITSKEYPAGDYSFQWDGRNDVGQPAATGMYLYRLTSDEFSLSKKMMLIK